MATQKRRRPQPKAAKAAPARPGTAKAQAPKADAPKSAPRDRKRKAASQPTTTHGALRKRSKRDDEERDAFDVDPQDPFAVGTQHWVLFRGTTPVMAEVVERRVRRLGAPPEYYVHFVEHDKRLDTWVARDAFLSEKDAERHLAAMGVESKKSARTLRRSASIGGSHSSVSSAAAAALSAPGVDPAYAQLEREHEEATRVKNIQRLELGRHVIDCWYFSPFPDEYAHDVDVLFICQHCLRYMKSRETYARHWHSCPSSGSPPGRAIYLKDGLAVYEVDGSNAKLFCQNLCLLAKLFLDHKTLYYDVTPFLFYVLFEVDANGTALHPVGYFSKEKASADSYNLACIMILPPYQKRGYGRFLIQLSYEITRREGGTGTPEKPLSDLGRLSYRSFWAHELLVALKRASSSRSVPTIADLCRETGFMREDIVETLTDLGLMRSYRGQHVLNMAPRVIDTHLKDLFGGKKMTLLDPEFLNWPQVS